MTKRRETVVHFAPIHLTLFHSLSLLAVPKFSTNAPAKVVALVTERYIFVISTEVERFSGLVYYRL